MTAQNWLNSSNKHTTFISQSVRELSYHNRRHDSLHIASPVVFYISLSVCLPTRLSHTGITQLTCHIRAPAGYTGGTCQKTKAVPFNSGLMLKFNEHLRSVLPCRWTLLDLQAPSTFYNAMRDRPSHYLINVTISFYILRALNGLKITLKARLESMIQLTHG